MIFRDHAAISIVIAVASFAGLIWTSISCIRANNVLAHFLRKRSDDWPVLLRRNTPAGSIFGIVIGTIQFPNPDGAYRELLWSARKWVLACLIFWMTSIIAI